MQASALPLQNGPPRKGKTRLHQLPSSTCWLFHSKQPPAGASLPRTDRVSWGRDRAAVRVLGMAAASFPPCEEEVHLQTSVQLCNSISESLSNNSAF